MATLAIRLFGVLSLERDGEPVEGLPGHKIRDLLAYLLINRQSAQSRERLAGVLWGDCTGDRARHCLNTALWRLRSALGRIAGDYPYLRIDSQQIGVNVASDLWLDVAEFESACERAARTDADDPGEQARWHRIAVGHYRGDLLVDCYDDWCLLERERLQRLYLRALGQLLVYHRHRAEYDDAIVFARRILACNPLREPVHRALIHLYLDSGDQTAALRHFQACERTFRQELGTDLMPETRALQRRLLSAVPPQRAKPSACPPSSVTALPTGGPQREPVSIARLEAAMTRVTEAQAQLAAATAQLDTLRRELLWERLGPGAIARPRGVDIC